MGKRKKHPSKEIEMAIQYAESCGWRYRKSMSIDMLNASASKLMGAHILKRRAYYENC